MTAPPTVAIERDSLEADVADLENAEREILDVMLLATSERDRLGSALMKVHSASNALRTYLAEGDPAIEFHKPAVTP